MSCSFHMVLHMVRSSVPCPVAAVLGLPRVPSASFNMAQQSPDRRANYGQEQALAV